jgi:DNA-binding HxlR family transcriptional regulator
LGIAKDAVAGLGSTVETDPDWPPSLREALTAYRRRITRDGGVRDTSPSDVIVDYGSLPVTGTVALAAGREVSIADTPAVTIGGQSRLVSDFRDARQNTMLTAESERNKATLRRLIDRMNTNDPEIISKTIDEVTRPGAMERSVDGLSAKVLADCLRSLLKFGVLSKQSFPEVPPRACSYISKET